MVEKLLEKLFKLRTVVGIEVNILPDDHFICRGVQLSLKKGLCVIDYKLPEIEAFSELRVSIGPNVPVSLSLNGRGVLHKKIAKSTGDRQNDISLILPNAKVDDFYIQQFQVGDGVFFSLIRKTLLHELLNQFKESNLMVVQVSLGIFAVEKLLPWITTESSQLILGNHCIQFTENLINDYQYERGDYRNQVIKIDDELLEENLLVSYATGVQTLSGINSFAVDSEHVYLERSERLYKRFFKTAGTAFLVFFLFVLLTNFFVFTHYSELFIQLSGNQVRFSDFKTDLDSLNKKITERESFLNSAGWMRPSRISYYADAVGGSVPTSILLTELSINPYQELLTRGEKKFMFDANKITIAGICNKPTDLNPWIQRVKMMPWVNRVEMQNYTFDNGSNKGKFIITVTIK